MSGRYARWDKPSPALQHQRAPTNRSDDRQLFRGSPPQSSEDDTGELHDLGLLFLVKGEPARAVATLEKAAEQKPSAAVLNDLSAAYLALAEEDQPWLRIDAVAAATRAVALAPKAPYASFNLALALERMALVHEAGLAWDRYLLLEDEVTWRKEVSERVARLRQPTARERWAVLKPMLWLAAAKGDSTTLLRSLGEFSGPIRDLLESELLPEAAEAIGTSNENTRLTVARRVAEAVATTGERLYIASLDSLERTTRGKGPAGAEGYREYAQGLALRGECPRATPLFERSLEALSANGSPLALAAQYQKLVCLSWSRPDEAKTLLLRLASTLRQRSYPTLLAKTEAMLGLCAVGVGHYSDALPHYEAAIKILRIAKESRVFAYQGMLDEAYRFLGDRNRAWSFRLSALEGSVAAGDRRYVHAVLAGLARELAAAGRREVALSVIDEMLANARAWKDNGAEVEALLRRVPLEVQLGNPAQAESDLRECARLLPAFRQGGDRERDETEFLVASAEQALASLPAEARKKSRSAIARAKRNGDALLLPRALLARARAEIAFNARQK